MYCALSHISWSVHNRFQWSSAYHFQHSPQPLHGNGHRPSILAKLGSSSIFTRGIGSLYNWSGINPSDFFGFSDMFQFCWKCHGECRIQMPQSSHRHIAMFSCRLIVTTHRIHRYSRSTHLNRMVKINISITPFIASIFASVDLIPLVGLIVGSMYNIILNWSK